MRLGSNRGVLRGTVIIVWWRYNLSVEEQGRSSRGGDQIPIDVVEFLAMAVAVYILAVARGDRPAIRGEPVFMRGDGVSEITRVTGAGGLATFALCLCMLMRGCWGVGDGCGLAFGIATHSWHREHSGQWNI